PSSSYLPRAGSRCCAGSCATPAPGTPRVCVEPHALRARAAPRDGCARARTRSQAIGALMGARPRDTAVSPTPLRMCVVQTECGRGGGVSARVSRAQPVPEHPDGCGDLQRHDLAEAVLVGADEPLSEVGAHPVQELPG